MTTSLNFSYFIRYLLNLLRNLVSEKSTKDSKVISYVLRGHINASWHLKMCSKFSAFLLQKGQNVLPSYFSVKFVLMSYILVLALKMALAYFGLRAVK